MAYHRVRISLLGLAIMSAHLVSTAYAAPAAQANVAYGADPEQVLDIYPAQQPGLHRLVVFVHGGGWMTGNKQGGQKIAGPLNQAGYTVASIGYRLVPHVDVAGSVQDVAQATAYLLRHAADFSIDPHRFALMGHSSGAHLVALLGTDQHYLQQAGVDVTQLAAVITLDGVFDLQSNLTRHPNETRQEVFGTDPALWTLLSPVSYVATMQAHPSFCVLHEDTNRRFIEQAEAFEAALQKRQEAMLTRLAPGLKHGELMDLFDSDAPMASFTLECLAKTR